jgi:excinuclease UvrABC nuclease subunit
MPFRPNYKAAFTREAIEQIPLTAYGVYGIDNPGDEIYVGKGEIRTRLLAHLGGDNSCITSYKPTMFIAELVSTEAEATRRETALILEYNPRCNKRVG